LEITAADGDDILLSLLDSNSNVLAKQANTKQVTSRFLKETKSTLAAGTYFLKIEENGQNATIDAYSLSISSKPVADTGTEAGSSGGGGYFSIELLSFLILLGLFKMRRKYYIND